MKFDVHDTTLLDHLIKMSGHNIPQSVNDLVETVVRAKLWDLESDFFGEYKYLPKPIQSINLERKILRTHNLLESWKKKYKFERIQEIDRSMSNVIDLTGSSEKESERVMISYCLAYLNKEEYEQYLQFDITDENLRIVKNWYRRKFGRKYEITLPWFDLITDYLSQMEFYDTLIRDFEDLKSGTEIKPPTDRYRFQTKLSETQIEKMYQKLLDGGFIDSITDKNEFLWSFGVDKKGFDSSLIVWLKSQTLAVYFIDTLYSFSFLINYEKMWVIGGNIFGFKNMAQTKQNYISTNKSNKPKGYESIDEIIDSL
jgi:hypothetical protein